MQRSASAPAQPRPAGGGPELPDGADQSDGSRWSRPPPRPGPRRGSAVRPTAATWSTNSSNRTRLYARVLGCGRCPQSTNANGGTSGYGSTPLHLPQVQEEPHATPRSRCRWRGPRSRRGRRRGCGSAGCAPRRRCRPRTGGRPARCRPGAPGSRTGTRPAARMTSRGHVASDVDDRAGMAHSPVRAAGVVGGELAQRLHATSDRRDVRRGAAVVSEHRTSLVRRQVSYDVASFEVYRTEVLV